MCITPQFADWFIGKKDIILAAPCYPTKSPDSRRAEGLFRGKSDAEDASLWLSVSFTFFSKRFWAAKLAYTHQLAVVWGNRLIHRSIHLSFWWNQRKSTSSPMQTTHPFFLLLFLLLLLLLLYSIILSDRPLLWALAPLLSPISGKQRGPLVCRHASSNWIIPEIWASAQKGICN